MSKTNRYAVHTQIKPAALARLRDLKEDFLRIQADTANRKRIIEEARARDNEWADYKAQVRPLKPRQGKLF
jgi:hypothetical protein